jgi:hypothetical protein
MNTYVKTLVSCDHYRKKPNWLKRLQIWVWRGKLIFNKEKDCWEEKYKVRGFIEKGWFYPDFLQSINYKIFWPYGQTNLSPEEYKQLRIDQILQKILQ